MVTLLKFNVIKFLSGSRILLANIDIYSNSFGNNEQVMFGNLWLPKAHIQQKTSIIKQFLNKIFRLGRSERVNVGFRHLREAVLR